MSKRKIDRKELHRLLYKEGKTQAEICRIFGASKGAVSQAVKDLKKRTTKALVTGKAKKVLTPSRADVTAQEIVRENIDAAAQMVKINRGANEMFDQLMSWQRGDPVAIQVLESQKRKIRIRGTKKTVTEYHFKDPRELCIRLMGEIREQVDLQLKIFSTLYDMEAFKEFKEAFLASIGKVNAQMRDEIIAHLQKDRLLPSGF